ncbi:hypothetical protein GARC_2340 [Paraglaciecola arctica BSs20135]|uniref:Uncharacterized protein n=1 Tax=Paraglaciecola arctica BSs20135 TaxID=493475 RepID=K6Y5V7_9ALTE|nr:hypothetical protein GARC_2340 [Paraglaciecola arctica BSs20135]
MIKMISTIILLTKSSVILAHELQSLEFFNRELLHYLLFDLIFIISVYFLFYLGKIALTLSKPKMKNTFSIYSQFYSEPPSKNR